MISPHLQGGDDYSFYEAFFVVETSRSVQLYLGFDLAQLLDPTVHILSVCFYKKNTSGNLGALTLAGHVFALVYLRM